ncbi:hypothetical protein [Desulfonema magnum]|uniref:Uncharacterized protein n=1 Tax=Desulfonema magnum TaxID=45655 RepID=A0A975GLP7_9BACT|nr:hypothetical protein [Desulfonema magnum]QTA86066.1 Uncharacterized protein dnm_020840 [Desulfonema magnum]
MIKKMIISVLVVIGMAISGMAFADEATITDQQQKVRPPRPFHNEDTTGNQQGFQPLRRPHKDNAGKLLGRYLHDNMLAEAISEMTGEAIETVMEKLKEQHPRALLEAYEIDPETFRSVMDGKTITLAEKAAGCGIITEEQAAEIVEKIQSHAAEHENSDTDM